MSEALPSSEIDSVEATEARLRGWRPSRQALTRLAIMATLPELPYAVLTGGDFVWGSPVDDGKGVVGWGRVALHAGQAVAHLGSNLWGLVT